MLCTYSVIDFFLCFASGRDHEPTYAHAPPPRTPRRHCTPHPHHHRILIFTSSLSTSPSDLDFQFRSATVRPSPTCIWILAFQFATATATAVCPSRVNPRCPFQHAFRSSLITPSLSSLQSSWRARHCPIQRPEAPASVHREGRVLRTHPSLHALRTRIPPCLHQVCVL